MKIRRATLDDADRITDLIHRCSEKHILPEFGLEGRATYLWSHNHDAIKTLVQTCAYWVAEKESRIIGVIGIQDRTHLYHLHVDPEFQKQGLGTRLWKTAQVRPQPRMTVNASRFAVPFYENLGFVLEGERNLNGVIYFPMVWRRTVQFDP